MNIKICRTESSGDMRDKSYYTWTFDRGCYGGMGCKHCPLSSQEPACVVHGENSISFINALKDYIADKPKPYKTTLAELQTTLPELFL